MCDGTPKNSLPRTVEPRRFAVQGAVLSGSVPTDALTRVAKADVTVIKAEATLRFGVDEQREQVVTGLLDVAVEMQCQRCLEAVGLQLSCPVNSAIVWDEEKAKQLPGSLDPWVVQDESADLYHMIEDEILLKLPYVAFHEQNCVDPALFTTEPGEEEPPENVEENNPFQVLEQLKGNTKD